MASLLAWVDYSSVHRADMDRLLDAFRDKNTIDELGVGTLRDRFSDLLFPGTSTLHTRARYLLFVPWAVTTVTARRLPTERAQRELRQLEVRVIDALRDGDIDGGVIGRDARANLRRMPSEVYWGALGAYRIRRCAHSISQHVRFASETTTLAVDEDEDVHHLRHLDPCFRQLPLPPDGWLENIDFELSRDEAEFLRERILHSCGDRYLGWLVQQDVSLDAGMPWDATLTADLPHDLARPLDHARWLSRLHEGGPILYNLLLARQKGLDESTDKYTDLLQSWSDSEETREAAATWDDTDFWRCLYDAGWRGNSQTRAFFTDWVRRVQARTDLANDADAAELIRRREISLKGGRSRFRNPDALDAWEGGTGMGRMTYRWSEARQLLTDIRDGLARSDA